MAGVTALWLGVVLVLFDGSRRIFLGDRSWRANIIFGLVLVFWCVATIAIATILVISLSRSPATSKPHELPDNNPARYANVTPDLAQKYSRSNAEFTFLTEGVLLKYFDGNGAWVLWNPSQQQLSEREQWLAANRFVTTAAQNLLLYAIGLLSAGTAILLGWRAAKHQRVETANILFNRTGIGGPSGPPSGPVNSVRQASNQDFVR